MDLGLLPEGPEIGDCDLFDVHIEELNCRDLLLPRVVVSLSKQKTRIEKSCVLSRKKREQRDGSRSIRFDLI